MDEYVSAIARNVFIKKYFFSSPNNFKRYLNSDREFFFTSRYTNYFACQRSQLCSFLHK